MIAATGRPSHGPVPGWGADQAGSPEFTVTFSRPAAPGGPLGNSFRWSGAGTIKITDRGLLVNARRRVLPGIHLNEQRFVPASEIADAYRESNSIRVDLKPGSQRRRYFQFWTRDAASAGTVARLLPTTRTIEYEEAHVRQTEKTGAEQSNRPASIALTMLVAAVAAAILGTSAMLLKTRSPAVPARVASETLEPVSAPVVPPSALPAESEFDLARDAEFDTAWAKVARFDDRIDALRDEFRTAFNSVQTGYLPQQDFIEGLERWMIPQWRALYLEQAAQYRQDGSLEAAIRSRLIRATLGWESALRDYANGLRHMDAVEAINALNRMSDANDDQRQARRLISRPAPPPPPPARAPGAG